MGSSGPPSEQPLPFVAPCRQLSAGAPLQWIQSGWRDLVRAPRQSLAYGVVIMLLSYVVTFLAWQIGSFVMVFALLSGFVFLGPILAIGLYSISCQLEMDVPPRLGYCLREGRRHLGNELLFGLILLIVFLVWARAATMVHIFFPVQAHPDLNDLLLFLGVGSAVGSVFAAIVFMASAFSLPMIMDRKVDMVTAAITSVNAVLRNKSAMIVWAGIIVGSVAVGFATAFVGFVVLMPLIGHATWHAYKQTIDASAWPQHEDLPPTPGV